MTQRESTIHVIIEEGIVQDVKAYDSSTPVLVRIIDYDDKGTVEWCPGCGSILSHITAFTSIPGQADLERRPGIGYYCANCEMEVPL